MLWLRTTEEQFSGVDALLAAYGRPLSSSGPASLRVVGLDCWLICRGQRVVWGTGEARSAIVDPICLKVLTLTRQFVGADPVTDGCAREGALHEGRHFGFAPLRHL